MKGRFKTLLAAGGTVLVALAIAMPVLAQEDEAATEKVRLDLSAPPPEVTESDEADGSPPSNPFELPLGPTAAPGQEAEEPAEEEPAAVDNTGTNPINFTYDARFYMETSWFDGGSLIAPTFEFRLPLGRDLANLTNQKVGIFNDLGNRFAIRLKVRPNQNLNLDDPAGDPTAGTNISGMGDMDFRFLAVPFANNKFGIAAGVEVFIPTATNDLLGTGKTSLRPQVFLGFFGLFGKNSIFAPGYLYVFDVAGDPDRPSVRQHQIDMYFVWLLAESRHWLIVNPQMNFDTVKKTEIYIVDVEFGYSIPQLPGAAIHIRPGVGIGSDRPFDWTFEFGLRFIWR